LKLNVDADPLGLAGLGGAGSLVPARAEWIGLLATAKMRITLTSKAAATRAFAGIARLLIG
jgi:hypothetical protein